jgi:aminomuconate-semialdehyde/2-hydroxymuconate-6-semialdehyde dehydrogenase
MPASLLDQLQPPSVPTTVQTLNHFINGTFCPSASGETFEDINPATGQRLADVALGGAEEIDQAVQAARQAFESGPWPRMAMAERARYVTHIGDLILAKLDALALAETLDTGKPITESKEGDIPRSAANCHFFADYAATLGETCFSPSPWERHLAVREPLGVAGLITPWNLPLYLATWKIAPALMMGNSVVLKPAEWTPYTATLFAEICQEADLPPGVFNLVHGLGAQSAGEALTRHPGVSALSFTGETTTGKAIMTAAAGTLKKVSFELGGKGASILFNDADLSQALPTAVRAAYRNQGQICLAGSRLFVQAGILEQVTEQLLAAVPAIRVGDPLDPATQMGSLIHPDHLAKVTQYIALAQQEGQWLTGGDRPAHLPDGAFLTPGLVAPRPGQTDFAQSRVCQEEIFGPVLPIIPFETEAALIRLVNSTPYGLSASLWSQDVNRCHRVAQQLQAGIVWVNCWFARDLRTPFGGQKASGIGREGGRYSLEFFSEAKTITYRYSPAE